MEFDKEYYQGLYQWIQLQDGKTFDINDLTEDYDKFVFHLKFYIETRTPDDAVLEFDSISESEMMYGIKWTKIKILEFFDGKISDNQRLKTHENFMRAQKDEENKKPHFVMQTPVAPVEQKKTIVKPNVHTGGLFQ